MSRGRLTANQRAKPSGSEHITREDAWQMVVEFKDVLDRQSNGMARSLTQSINKPTNPTYRITLDEAYENAQGAAYEGALRAVEALAPNFDGVEGYMLRSARNAVFRAFEDLIVQMGGDGSHRKDRRPTINIGSLDGLMEFGPWNEDSGDEETLPAEVQEKIMTPSFDDTTNALVDYERGDTPTQRALRGILTPTQWEVLQMAADGLSVNEIAQLREVSAVTVKTHLEDARRRARGALA